MSEESGIAPPRLEDLDYDLDAALAAVVFLRSRAPADALTAQALGTERSGHGVLIAPPGAPPGLILTIGYLLTEARELWVIGPDQHAVPGQIIGIDPDSGLGLAQTLGPLPGTPLELGSGSALQPGEALVAAGHGGRRAALGTWLIGRQTFAGYWEYLLEDALLTAPPHPNWGGAALLDPGGRLSGIGSLLIQSEADGETTETNLFVPVDPLAGVLDDLLRYGRVQGPARPWLGLMCAERDETLVVLETIPGGPAEQAGLRTGDRVLAVAETPVNDLEGFLRRLWALGPAGTVVPLTLQRGSDVLTLRPRSSDRRDHLKPPVLH
ncbi:MAG: S1C family serine protease [Candidatus Competibacterales bacterium]|nr:S1C family serine protease [Candidatus Competibacterales bacterium]